MDIYHKLYTISVLLDAPMVNYSLIQEFILQANVSVWAGTVMGFAELEPWRMLGRMKCLKCNGIPIKGLFQKKDACTLQVIF